MRTKLFNFTKAKSSQYYFDKLPKEEQDILNEFKDKLLVSASELRSVSAVKEVLRFRYITGKHLDKITLEDLQYYLREIKNSSFSDHFKNKIKGFVQRFLKWNYKKDWTERFEEFEDIGFDSDAERKKPITSEDVLTKEQMDKLLETEKNLFWKTFLIVQYEGAFRTGEVRKLKWSDVTFKDQGFTEIKVSSRKNKQAKEKFRELPLERVTKFLTALKKQQRAEGIKSDWVFPSPVNPNKHISKSVNAWFNKLIKKALGNSDFNYNYLLRHTRGTELSNLVLQGKIAKSLALKFMGHSERMFDKVYSHTKDKFLKDEMKSQIYDFEYMPEEKKHELEKEIEGLKNQVEVDGLKNQKEIDELKNQVERLAKNLDLQIISADKRYEDFNVEAHYWAEKSKFSKQIKEMEAKTK